MLTQLVGPVAAGDRVVVNTTAVDLGLGTGGWHVVHWNLGATSWAQPGARPHHEAALHEPAGRHRRRRGARPLDAAADLDGLPVVVCGLHSQVAVRRRRVRARAPARALAYVMTDGGALPARAVRPGADLRAAACSTPPSPPATRSAATSRRSTCRPRSGRRPRDRADAVVVAMGPGVVGTGTDSARPRSRSRAAIDAVARSGEARGGRALLRHRRPPPRTAGVSHHTLTALGWARSPGARRGAGGGTATPTSATTTSFRSTCPTWPRCSRRTGSG